MASVEQKFRALQRENPHHSSLINFVRAISNEPLSKTRVVFYFKKLVSKGDYEASEKQEVCIWLNTLTQKQATQKQGFFGEKTSKSAQKSPTLKSTTRTLSFA